MESYRIGLFVLAMAALAAPLLTRMPTSFRMPVVVAELLIGMFIGPHVFDWLQPDGLVGMLGELGLTFLLFMVGLEINFNEIQGKPLTLAVGGWFLSFTVAMFCMYFVHAIGLIQAPPILAAIALSTTAVGVLAPILRDEGIIGTDFGKLLLSAGSMGELGPLLAISLLVIPTHTTFLNTVFVVAFVGLTVVIADAAIHPRSSRWLQVLSETMQSSGQVPVRICIALQALLVVLAGEFGLNVVVGAFAAGMVVGMASKGESGQQLRHKLDAIGYGFLIPIFFITAGMKVDLSIFWGHPLALAQVTCLLGLFVLVRGAPILLYRQHLSPYEKIPFALYSATGLPLIVVISDMGVSMGLMAPDKAALLVAAGMISVLAFPIWAKRLLDETAMN
ncbi:cation:proton antiporter [Methylomonas koyamae]|uniref:Sodium:proton exchanger n=1 Tax=Methylomonas koyamae TaxID=702114 RepID=A0A291ILD4_9GAMM|nr:cation:proton antiporter [Methylomonas koyamae]ATG91011.1 sodium:proton exchanger [Methylomonas koyamae]OAI26492.1 sodium:proton exchanger [Methylomonas koyamae]WNB77453.1 cation:proton antiporter [Methylomonas koyamae]